MTGKDTTASVDAESAAAAPGTRRRGVFARERIGLVQLAVYIGLTVLVVPLQFGTGPVLPLPVSAPLIFAVGAATLWFRRRHQTLALAVALILLLLSFWVGLLVPEIALVGFLLYATAAERPARIAWSASAAAVAVAVVASMILALRFFYGPSVLGSQTDNTFSPEPRPDYLFSTFWGACVPGVLGMIIITLMGLNVSHRRRLARARADLAEQERREREQQLVNAKVEERERIAREMHDVIAHSLAVMITVADGARATVVRDPEECREAIGRVADTGRRTLGEVRRLLGSVRGDSEFGMGETAPPPVVRRLPDLAAEFRAAGLPVRLLVDGALPVDSGRELTIYRVVQESLTNVLRHATDTSDVLVRVRVTQHETSVLVEDTSAPAAVSENAGRGLLGMRERAAIYDGIAEAGPRPGGGWRVNVRLPGEK